MLKQWWMMVSSCRSWACQLFNLVPHPPTSLLGASWCCVFVLPALGVLVTQSRLTLSEPVDCIPPGSSVRFGPTEQMFNEQDGTAMNGGAQRSSPQAVSLLSQNPSWISQIRSQSRGTSSFKHTGRSHLSDQDCQPLWLRWAWWCRLWTCFTCGIFQKHIY